MRIVQPTGTRGSLKWMQKLVSEQPHVLNKAIQDAGGLNTGGVVTWVSPLREDGWAEYRDRTFLEKVGYENLANQLASFWPRGGPQWDALGATDDREILLVEAKAHVAEMASTCQASPTSRALIANSLEKAKVAFGASLSANWLEGYYQYANRLAHLHFLQKHQVPAKLIFVYFTNDEEMKGPQSKEEWNAKLVSANRHLGIEESLFLSDVISVYIDTRSL